MGLAPLASVSGRTLSLGLSQRSAGPVPLGAYFVCVCVCVCTRACFSNTKLSTHRLHACLRQKDREMAAHQPRRQALQAHVQGGG